MMSLYVYIGLKIANKFTMTYQKMLQPSWLLPEQRALEPTYEVLLGF